MDPLLVRTIAAARTVDCPENAMRQTGFGQSVTPYPFSGIFMPPVMGAQPAQPISSVNRPDGVIPLHTDVKGPQTPHMISANYVAICCEQLFFTKSTDSTHLLVESRK
jgi:hypothetical protein